MDKLGRTTNVVLFKEHSGPHDALIKGVLFVQQNGSQDIQLLLAVHVRQGRQVIGVLNVLVHLLGIHDKLSFEKQLASPLQTVLNVGRKRMKQTFRSFLENNNNKKRQF